jgi:hypothetical protein
MLENDEEPEQRANLEALIKYFEDGGKVPEGNEEVRAFDGQASFGIRFYTRFDQMPEGWLFKQKWCDVRCSCLCRDWSRGPPALAWPFLDPNAAGIRFADSSLQSSKWCQINSVPKPDDYLISDAQGRVLL